MSGDRTQGFWVLGSASEHQIDRMSHFRFPLTEMVSEVTFTGNMIEMCIMYCCKQSQR
jgi:hypothetical protein